MPAPLFRHLKEFCTLHYERGITPSPKKYYIDLTKHDLEDSWFRYGTQLRDLSTLFFNKYEVIIFLLEKKFILC